METHPITLDEKSRYVMGDFLAMEAAATNYSVRIIYNFVGVNFSK
jgi:hypothetical protein